MADIEKANNSESAHHHAAPRPGFLAPVAGYGKVANPAPLGLFSFASTTLILSLINVQARHVNVPNIVVGMALAVGGLCQLLAGMWEFAAGNTFGATAFTSYGGFWMAFALIYWPSSGILDAYSGPTADQANNAVGIFLLVWFIFTFLMFLASLRSTAALASLFFFLTLTFMLLMIGAFLVNEKANKAGGGLGIVTAAIAYYCASSHVINQQTSYFPLPLGHLPKNDL